jgi:integrase
MKTPPPPTRVSRGPAEAQAILARLEADTRDIYWFLLRSGVREDNALKLRWPQIDWSARKIHFVQKGDRNHVVSITDAIAEILRRQAGNHPVYVFTDVCLRPRHETDRKTGARVIREQGRRYPFTKTVLRQRWNKVPAPDLNIHASAPARSPMFSTPPGTPSSPCSLLATRSSRRRWATPRWCRKMCATPSSNSTAFRQ